MSPEQAARTLLKQLGAPARSVSAWVVREHSNPVIVLKVSPDFRPNVQIPRSFEGFQIRVEPKRPAIAFRLANLLLKSNKHAKI